MAQPTSLAKNSGPPQPRPQTPPSPNMGNRVVSKGNGNDCLSWCWDKICALFAALRDLFCFCSSKPLPPIQPPNTLPPTEPQVNPPSSPSPPPGPSIDTTPPSEIPQEALPLPQDDEKPPTGVTPGASPNEKRAGDFVEGHALDLEQAEYDYSDLTFSEPIKAFKASSIQSKLWILRELTAPDRFQVPDDVIREYVRIACCSPLLTLADAQLLHSLIKDRKAIYHQVEILLSRPEYAQRQPIPNVSLSAALNSGICFGWVYNIIQKYVVDDEDFQYASLAHDPLADFRKYTQSEKLQFLMTLTAVDRSQHKGHADVLAAFLAYLNPDADNLITLEECNYCRAIQADRDLLYIYLTELHARVKDVEEEWAKINASS